MSITDPKLEKISKHHFLISYLNTLLDIGFRFVIFIYDNYDFKNPEYVFLKFFTTCG